MTPRIIDALPYLLNHTFAFLPRIPLTTRPIDAQGRHNLLNVNDIRDGSDTLT